MFLDDLGIDEPGSSLLIRESHKLLNLSTFYTAGPKEVRAWTFKNGSKAPQAAGTIHTDFEKGFIRAEVISYNELLKVGTTTKAKELGKMRVEGKDYIMQDGDVVYFRFNV